MYHLYLVCACIQQSCRTGTKCVCTTSTTACKVQVEVAPIRQLAQQLAVGLFVQGKTAVRTTSTKNARRQEARCGCAESPSSLLRSRVRRTRAFFVFPFSLFQCVGVAGLCILWHGVVLLLSTWYNVAARVVVLRPHSLHL